MEIHQEVDVTEEDELRASVKKAEAEFAHEMWAGNGPSQMQAAKRVREAREAWANAIRLSGSSL